MCNRQENAKANRKHLLEPINVIALLCISVFIVLFLHYRLDEYALGYALSTLFIVSQMLFTTRRKIRINTFTLVVGDPLMLTAAIILAFYILDII